MRNIKFLFCSVLIFLFSISLPVYADAPKLNSDCAVLMDMDTGQILYEKNGYQINIMGNMTKLLNVSTAVNNGEMGQLLTINYNCLAETTRDELAGNIGLQPGQMITLEDALFAEIMSNANDAARVVAGNLGDQDDDDSIGTSNDVKTYLEMMKYEARYLKAASLSVASVMGMWSPDQICSTVDLANIIRLGFENSDFRRILSTKEFDITIYKADSTTSLEQEDSENSSDAKNTNDKKSADKKDSKTENTTETTEQPKTVANTMSLTSGHAMMNGTVSNRSVKGGFVVKTDSNGFHSVTYAKRSVEGFEGDSSPRRFVVAIMNSPDEDSMYADITALLDYGYEEWSPFTLAADKLISFLPSDLQDKKIVFSEDMTCLLPQNMGKGDLEAKTAVDENNFCSGTVTFSVAGVSEPVYKAAFYEDSNTFAISSGVKTIIYIFIAIVALILIFLILRYMILPYYNKAKAIGRQHKAGPAKEKTAKRTKAINSQQRKKKAAAPKNRRNNEFKKSNRNRRSE